jgi:serine/threonine-protein kinase RsbW
VQNQAMKSDDLHVDINIGSRFENIDLVDAVAEAMLRHAGLEEESVDRLGLAIREAVANGVQHGNCEDPTKRVTVSFVLSKEEVRVQIKDEGEGFDLESLPDPLDPQNLFKPRGRGILLMNSFMDEVDYRFEPGGGTTVVLRKTIETPKVEDTEEGEA